METPGQLLHLRLSAPREALAAKKMSSTPSYLVLSLRFIPCLLCRCHLCLCFSPPRHSWHPSGSAALWVPYQAMIVMHCHGFFKACPIHLHFLLLISTSIG
ncbi:hypothetical protein ElyMa_004321500 [Elysia marginata]|uniref:Uncharacterized protein n=1 Tax=Elysia marginata TaxID=1093978 RepID=A0AAV4GZ41_9GAST|nr:hypothetical protein ElyMa_004321500 [Elysia marginata]